MFGRHKDYLPSIEDIPVALLDVNGSGPGQVHIVGVTQDDGRCSTMLTDEQFRKLSKSMETYGGNKQLGELGRAEKHPIDGRFIITVGLGEKREWRDGPKRRGEYQKGNAPALLERVRNAVGKGVEAVRGLDIQFNRVTFDQLGVGLGKLCTQESLLDAAVTAAVRSGYQGIRGLSTDRKKDAKIGQISIFSRHMKKDAKVFASAQRLGKAESLARLIGECPSNIFTPYSFEEVVEKVVENYGDVLNIPPQGIVRKEQLMAEDGRPRIAHPYAALGAVASGSTEAALIKVEYRGNVNSQKKLAIVGKGITFDTGGHNIKPTGAMEDMFGDKYGAATVVGTMDGVAALNLPINVDWYICTTENNPGKEAYHPGDLLYMGNDSEGKPFPAIQVQNTDAEGRLVMATAIALAESDPDVEMIMDFSTLTGAMLVATGSYRYGLTVDRYNQRAAPYLEAFLQAGELSGEQFAHFHPDAGAAKRLTKAAVFPEAIANLGPDRWGSHFDAYFMLERFTGEKPFLHCDMAGSLVKGNGKAYMGATPVFNVPPVIAAVMALETIANLK